MLTCQGHTPKEPTTSQSTTRVARPPHAYGAARRLVVILLAARLDEGESRTESGRLLPIAARLANAALTPERRLATPHLLRLLICLDELEAAGLIDSELATELWRAAAAVHAALQDELTSLERLD